MRRLVFATAMGGVLCLPVLQPAKAWGGGGGFVVGTFAGLAAGTVVGAAIAHPYYPYPYPYYGYPYYYGAPVVAAPYPYPYPYPGYGAANYAPPPAAFAPRPPEAPGCGLGQFFNTYTGTCDRR